MRNDDPTVGDEVVWDTQNQNVIDNLGEALSHAEDAINDALPEGYYAKVES